MDETTIHICEHCFYQIVPGEPYYKGLVQYAARPEPEEERVHQACFQDYIAQRKAVLKDEVT